MQQLGRWSFTARFPSRSGAIVASNVSLAHRPTDSRGFSCVAETALGHFAETELTKSEKSGQRSRTAGITV